MKHTRIISLFAMLLFFSLAFIACEDNTTNPEPSIPKPMPVEKLEASSVDSTTVLITWEHSKSKDSSMFDAYYVTVTPGNHIFKVPLPNNTITISGLTEGTEYTFSVVAKFTTPDSSTAETIVWSPASRFDDVVNGVKMYESASELGSGLKIFDVAEWGPKNIKISNNKAECNIALFTEEIDGVTNIQFGSANALYLAQGDVTNNAEFVEEPTQGTSIESYTNAKPLDQEYGVFSSKYYDFSEYTFEAGMNPIFICRVKNGTDYNYARIMMKRGENGQFLQGVSPNRYVELVISYQKVANKPYAK
jgi:hypothetical protein